MFYSLDAQRRKEDRKHLWNSSAQTELHTRFQGTTFECHCTDVVNSKKTKKISVADGNESDSAGDNTVGIGRVEKDPDNPMPFHYGFNLRNVSSEKQVGLLLVGLATLCTENFPSKRFYQMKTIFVDKTIFR